MFTKLIDALKATRRTIVFTEGPDARILEAADRLIKDDLMNVILIGNVDEVKAAAEKGGFDIAKAEIIDPATYAGMDEMVAKMVELRKGKMSEEDCRKALAKGNYFGTMLVKMGKADALLGGATYSTADTVRPALQLVKTKKGAHLVSSCFILDRDCGEEGLKRIAMGDCAVNIDYTDTVDKATGEVKISAASKLAEVAVETARTAKLFGIDPKVAVLSFSTKGSGKGGTVALSHDATIKAQEMDPELAVDGELQFDAAVSPVVYGHATTYSVDVDQDGLGGAGTPKYVFAENDSRLMVMATEQLEGRGMVVVSGAAFMSNFEVQASISDNGSEKNYSNYKICQNLVSMLNQTEITKIADVQAETEEGVKFTVEGIVTSNASGYNKDTAFFDCIYVQDNTAGINAFPVAGNFKIGDKVRVTGTTSSYQGERQLAVTKIEKIADAESPAPVEVTAAQINDGSVLGSLVKIKGTITRVEEAEGKIQTIMFIGLALVEVLALIGFVAALII